MLYRCDGLWYRVGLCIAFAVLIYPSPTRRCILLVGFWHLPCSMGYAVIRCVGRGMGEGSTPRYVCVLDWGVCRSRGYSGGQRRLFLY
ncbi:hypothetical protein BO86DRAFT_74445 [Aspergillus japonicus CBS 114.51]|uniref:Uncharacterized protein n=1 Tax=Aspergillus japonicus CBS 114.51 TaxID=1448312 RepID=A0A8T8XHS2_ASPJA|nr:hypothetical protein BO86DRAFT_74445 [Aspergillus japonicus CBS 114.51]RAH86939.1 hypothetical protein BO86DRAFT_74445 [Aspergillus japonicus CBS 114.51]